MKPDGAGLCVVGDDAQSIYSFRAATVENILGFPGHFQPPAAMVALEDNYRSTQPILDAANALMAEASQQYRKELRSRRSSGARPRHVTVLDDQGQADYVCERVLEAREQGSLLRKQAVLFRSSHHSDVLELELTRRRIPYVKYGGSSFWKPRTSRTCSRCCDGPIIRATALPVFAFCSCCRVSVPAGPRSA